MKEVKLTFEDIYRHIRNSVQLSELLYWANRLKEANELGIEFAQETYNEDLKNCGGVLIFFD